MMSAHQYKHQQHEPRVKPSRRRAASESKKPMETLDIVDLSGMSLESLPNPTLNLASICKLDISNNTLQRIPESLTARLLNLVVLDVHSNQLTILPNSIGCLSKLKVLNVAGNYLSSLPNSIQNCRLLEELNVNFNKLTGLPDNIGFELINLKKLSISSNKLMFLPRSISHLTSLRVLDARLNCLRSIPDDLENLTNLEVLNVSQNFQYLRSLPYSVGLLLSLIELDISYNTITTLPDPMGCLKKLQKLSVEGNPLASPPMEVVEQGLHAVKEYLREKLNAGHTSPPKKKSWIRKLVKHGTFNGHSATTSTNTAERERFIPSDYHAISALASPSIRLLNKVDHEKRAKAPPESKATTFASSKLAVAVAVAISGHTMPATNSNTPKALLKARLDDFTQLLLGPPGLPSSHVEIETAALDDGTPPAKKRSRKFVEAKVQQQLN